MILNDIPCEEFKADSLSLFLFEGNAEAWIISKLHKLTGFCLVTLRKIRLNQLFS